MAPRSRRTSTPRRRREPGAESKLRGRFLASVAIRAEDHTMLALAAAGLPVVDQVNVDVSDASCLN